jgi:hypothetical protein
MTGCHVNVHFIGGRMPQKRPGRAARCGPGPGKPGNTSGPAGARFGLDVALLDVLPPRPLLGLLWPSPPTSQFAPTPRAVHELITASAARHRGRYSAFLTAAPDSVPR